MAVSLDKTSPIINDIAQSLDCGHICYFNTSNNEFIEIIDFEPGEIDEEFEALMEADLIKIKASEKDFIKIEPLKSFEHFNIMQAFCDQLPDLTFQNKLNEALHNRRPFHEFKYLVENSPFRQNWFDFKTKKIGNYVYKKLTE